jgi:hypothetical protein
MAKLKETSGEVLFKPEFFGGRECVDLGISIRTVKGIVQFPNREVLLRYDVGTRTNGVDEAHWSKNLMVPRVSPEVL